MTDIFSMLTIKKTNHFFYFFIFFFLISISVQSQDTLFEKQLAQSEYLKYTIKAEPENSGLNRWLKKSVLYFRDLPLANDFANLKLTGPGTMRVEKTLTHSGSGSILIETPSSLAVKNPTNRSYATSELIRNIPVENLKEYNRFSVWVYADAPGFNSVFVGCTLFNTGIHPMPTPGRFEGQHFETVYPGKWHHIIWEVPDLYRDSVTGFGVNIMLTGSPKGAGDKLKLYVDDMRIEKVEAENTRGFDLRKNGIAYSHSGYRLNSRKQALVQHASDSKFQLLDQKNKVVFNGKGKQLLNGFTELDFSSFNTPGFYTIKTNTVKSQPFAIGADAYLATAWRTLNFFFAERCGYDQPGIHQECHQDVTCIHPDGRQITVNGGWHDAADLTQGIGNTAKSGIAMLELAKTVNGKQKKLYNRLLEEARWGLNWIMKTKFGDGYRLGGVIIGIWTDNIIGTKDDIRGNAANNPSDNFIAAAYAALAAPLYIDTDPVFASLCRKSAIEDFMFANELLAMSITEKNEAELYAKATISAIHLYRLTKGEEYLNWAIRYAGVLMNCQQREKRTDWSLPLHGFFYESQSKKRILEYAHKSDEYLIIQALAMLLQDLPQHAEAKNWKQSCSYYADYLHDISNSIAPYGILPAAVYELNNATFAGIYHEGEKVGLPSMEEYNAQVKNGIQLSANFYLRRFPVSYQFRGFHAILISKAKAALLLSNLLQDETLKNIGIRQLEYIVGYNPFAMSTIYGDGYDYPPLYGAYAGDVTGAVPVGIETFENEDEPYMPMQANATYKEIWTYTTAGVIDLLALLLSK